MVWDIFCRVIDNFGDVGVCWRLAAALGQHGQAVRLWIDDASALAWLAPQGAPGVQVHDWADPPPGLLPGQAVIEAFGCHPPDAFVARMAALAASAHPPGTSAPVWINLEYLSAEPYVVRSHGLLSPQFSGPGAGLRKWFFYPGFSDGTGGLLQGDAGQTDAAANAANALAWARAQGWAGAPDERAVTLFCYANPALPALLAALAGRAGPGGQATVLWVPPGPVRAQLDTLRLPDGLRRLDLPYLAQTDFDSLLAAADLNVVRGEDSFVRAQLLSSRPMLWQAYPQQDAAHLAKIQAFLGLYLAGWPAPLAAVVRQAWLGLNSGKAGPLVLPDEAHWQAWADGHAGWRQQQLARPDLCQQLMGFVAERAGMQATQPAQPTRSAPKPG